MVSFKKIKSILEVEGNGNIISKRFEISSFLRLHLGTFGTVYLIKSDEESITVETDENLMEYFEAGNSGRTLYVSSSSKLRKPAYTSHKIFIRLRQLEDLVIRCENGNVITDGNLTLTEPITIKLQTVGNVELDLNAPSIKLTSQSVGNLTLKGNTDSLEIKNQSVGTLDAENLLAKRLKIKNQGVGNIDLNASETIEISHMGTGYVHFKGDAVLKNVKQFGSGEIKHVS